MRDPDGIAKCIYLSGLVQDKPCKIQGTYYLNMMQL